MTYVILRNGKPIKWCIDRKVCTFETVEEAQKFADNHRANSRPATFSNTIRQAKYEIKEVAA